LSALARALWERAEAALEGARILVSIDPDGSASRAYYAAFNAVSAFFAKRDVTFVKHKAVETAVHRDLVLAGLWPKTLGADYSFLHRLRNSGDYGGESNVSQTNAEMAVAAAERILDGLRGSLSDDS
jgi:uncharacterized protein (UPF0332 family)